MPPVELIAIKIVTEPTMDTMSPSSLSSRLAIGPVDRPACHQPA